MFKDICKQLASLKKKKCHTPKILALYFDSGISWEHNKTYIIFIYNITGKPNKLAQYLTIPSLNLHSKKQKKFVVRFTTTLL